MKKTVWLLLLTLCITTINAQNGKPFRLGLTGTSNFGWLKPDTRGLEAAGAQANLGFGLIAEFMIADSENYYLTTGFNLQNVGGKIIYNDLMTRDNIVVEGENKTSYIVKYLNIPLAIKMRTNQIGYFNYFGKIGLNSGFKLNANKNIRQTYISSTERFNELDADDNIKGAKAELIIGFGFEYEVIPKSFLLVGLTFNNGFTNVLEGRHYTLDSAGNINDQLNSPSGEIISGQANSISLDIGFIF